MRFLVHSNGPHVKTGYGVQTRYLVERLHDAGHEVAVSCTYGIQGSIMPWGPRQIRLYPTGYETNSNDVIHSHALHYFDGDPQGGWIIPLLDLWCLVNPRLAEFNVAGWCPVDHFPVPPDVLKFFHRNPDAIPIAMSRFGERELFNAGLEPVYIPLAVDTNEYRPRRTIDIGGKTVTGRELLGVPEDAFCVGMVAMNKGWARDRKGFNEAFRAFGAFWKNHQNAVLYVHADWPGGAEGMNLKELATHAAIPDHALVWVDQYAYRTGFTPDMMATAYSAMDVLLAPSHGEGFGVPLIEAQACGTPVIATDFSAQSELIGAGWKVLGQPEWDPAQHASYVCPYIDHVVQALEQAYNADLAELAPKAVAFAQQYDADRVFQEHWIPFIASLEAGDVEPVVREPMPDQLDSVAVIVPVMKRLHNVRPLVESFVASGAYDANLYLVCDPDEYDDYREAAGEWSKIRVLVSDRGSTFAQKVNSGVAQTTEPWLFLCGDDVRFHSGWVDAARKVSDHADVIGTNDTPPGTRRNGEVADGTHSDHFFVRRAYVDEEGACLDGPGVLAPECYGHWWVDKEIVGLAKARGVFVPCLESVVEHLHPGYLATPTDELDEVYHLAISRAADDRKTFLSRAPLIQMQRVKR